MQSVLVVHHDDKHLAEHLDKRLSKPMIHDDVHNLGPLNHSAKQALSHVAKHDAEDHHPAHPAQKAAAKTQGAVVQEHKDHLDDAHRTMQAIHSVQSAIKATTPAESSKPHNQAMKEAEAHLESAKTCVGHTNAAINDVKFKAKKVTEAHVKSAKASHDAHKAAVNAATTKQAHRGGKATKEHVTKAEKEADDTATVAQEAAAKFVQAETIKKKADIKVAAHKAETKTDVESAKKMAMIAAKTAKPGEASSTKKAAEQLKKAVGHLEPKHPHEHIMKIKTDCDFLENAVLLGDLKNMPHVDPEYSCVGFGGHMADGEMKVAAIKCKPMNDGHCPISYDESFCKIVPLDINHIEFKQLF